VGLFFFEELGSGDLNGPRNQGFKNNKLLSWMMMGLGMKVSICVSLLSINLVGERAIRETRDKNI
jgi:hypothetical protein